MASTSSSSISSSSSTPTSCITSPFLPGSHPYPQIPTGSMVLPGISTLSPHHHHQHPTHLPNTTTTGSPQPTLQHHKAHMRPIPPPLSPVVTGEQTNNSYVPSCQQHPLHWVPTLRLQTSDFVENEQWLTQIGSAKSPLQERSYAWLHWPWSREVWWTLSYDTSLISFPTKPYVYHRKLVCIDIRCSWMMVIKL